MKLSQVLRHWRRRTQNCIEDRGKCERADRLRGRIVVRKCFSAWRNYHHTSLKKKVGHFIMLTFESGHQWDLTCIINQYLARSLFLPLSLLPFLYPSFISLYSSLSPFWISATMAPMRLVWESASALFFLCPMAPSAHDLLSGTGEDHYFTMALEPTVTEKGLWTRSIFIYSLASFSHTGDSKIVFFQIF